MTTRRRQQMRSPRWPPEGAASPEFRWCSRAPNGQCLGFPTGGQGWTHLLFRVVPPRRLHPGPACGRCGGLGRGRCRSASRWTQADRAVQAATPGTAPWAVGISRPSTARPARSTAPRRCRSSWPHTCSPSLTHLRRQAHPGSGRRQPAGIPEQRHTTDVPPGPGHRPVWQPPQARPRQSSLPRLLRPACEARRSACPRRCRR